MEMHLHSIVRVTNFKFIHCLSDMSSNHVKILILTIESCSYDRYFISIIQYWLVPGADLRIMFLAKFNIYKNKTQSTEAMGNIFFNKSEILKALSHFSCPQ